MKMGKVGKRKISYFEENEEEDGEFDLILEMNKHKSF